MIAVDLALDLVRFDTVSPPGSEDACARHLAELLSRGGFAVDPHAFAPDRTGLVAHLAGVDAALAPLAFTGHLDTVPLGDRAWSREAFGEIAEQRLYGRGSSDMKGGVAAFVAASLAFAASGRRPARGLTLVLTAGEETGCKGARHMAAGGVLGRASALVVAEPTANRLGIAHKGALHLTVRTAGRTAHGSMPQLGDNAVLKAMRAVAAIDALRFDTPAHPLLGAPTATVTSIHGGAAANVVPDACLFTLDVRTLPGQAHADVLQALTRALGPEACIDPPLVDVGAVGTPADDPFVAAVAQAMRASGLDGSDPIGLPYFTDGSVLQPALEGCPTVIFGPGEPGQAHQTDEWCSIPAIEAATSAYAALIAAWCRG